MPAVTDGGGLGCESLYNALSQIGVLSFDTLQRVLAVLGLTMAMVPAQQRSIAKGG